MVDHRQSERRGAFRPHYSPGPQPGCTLPKTTTPGSRLPATHHARDRVPSTSAQPPKAQGDRPASCLPGHKAWGLFLVFKFSPATHGALQRQNSHLLEGLHSTPGRAGLKPHTCQLVLVSEDTHALSEALSIRPAQGLLGLSVPGQAGELVLGDHPSGPPGSSVGYLP